MNEFKKDKPTSEQLVDLIDDELDITICSDVVRGLDFEYKKLQQENKILKENAEHNDKVVDKVNWENNLLKQQNKKYKEVIDKAKNKLYEWGEALNPEFQKIILDILKEVEDANITN